MIAERLRSYSVTRCQVDQYFTTQEGALKRLIRLRRESQDGPFPSPTVVGQRKDGVEVRGLLNALTDLRAGRLACYFHSSPTDEHIVFIS
jgi:hypothetical protein